MKEVGVGLIGFGTVGAGVAQGLLANGELLASRLGARPVLKAIADLDIETDRGVEIHPSLLTRDAGDVMSRDDVDIVVELVGGIGVAGDLVMTALRNGKAVVTANKALLAERGGEIFGLAGELDADLYFGASVGGGIPIIRSLRDGLVANHIESISAILNGTCNYIATRMEEAGLSFDDALQEAQDAGYAEADPTLDIGGFDTAHKAVILARLAYDLPVAMDQICIEGISSVSAADLAYAHDLGYRIKLLAIIKHDGERVEVRVHPTLVPVSHVLASVSGVFNAAMLNGDLVGQTLYYGRGAGRGPTASTVLADVADATRDIARGVSRGWTASGESRHTLKPIGDIRTRYYLRISLLDSPGALSRVATVLCEQNISIASVLQAEQCAGAHVPVVIVTHEARESAIAAALATIDAEDIVDVPTVKLRIED